MTSAPARQETLRSRGFALPLVRVALWALTGVALGMRIVGMDQTLYGDENFTYGIVTRNGLGGVWHAVYHTSITPPLHYYLAWLSVQFGGDGMVLVRLPSLVFGTAIVPLVFAIARRCAGPRAGVLAAATMAFDPFAIWYSNEARNYATMMFLLALSIYALLRAVDGGGRRWWALFALSACASLWSHYTAVFVVVVECVWALWARRAYRRETLFAAGAIVIGYLPWVPGFLNQRRQHVGIEVINDFAPLHLSLPFTATLRTLVGHPFVGLRALPGAVGVAMLAVLAALLLVAAMGGFGRLRQLLPVLRTDSGLILLLALATPVGLLIYAIGGKSLFLPRNLSASLPALAVIAAVLVSRTALLVRPPVAAAATLALVVLLGVNGFKSLGDSYRRPAYREAAHYIDRTARPGDSVVETSLASVVGFNATHDKRLTPTTIDLYLHHRRPVYLGGVTDSPAWRRLPSGASAFNVTPASLFSADFLRARVGNLPPGLLRRLQALGGPNGLAIVRAIKTFPGIIPVDVIRYSGAASGRLERHGRQEVISWTLGRHIDVARGVARGAVDNVSPSNTRLLFGGWALQAGGPPRLVDWFLLFFHGRLFAAAPGGQPRPDVAQLFGPAALPAGFGVIPSPAPADHAAIRAFAVVGKRASELPWSPAARRAVR